MSDRKGSPGSWAAAVAGGGLGAVSGIVGVDTHRASRGYEAARTDEALQLLRALNSPEKVKAFVAEHGIEKVRDTIDSLTHSQRTVTGDKAADIIKEIEGQLAKLGAMDFTSGEGESEGLWKGAHEAIEEAAKSIKELGVRKGLLASIPGGSKTAVTAAALLGAALTYMAVKGIHHSIHESAQEGNRGR